MDTNHHHNRDSLPPQPHTPPDVDLYTIPSHSCWFSWDSIHDTERSELGEFFDGSSFTRTPKIYKDYRDFIITMYRENPNPEKKRLTFTEVRKALVGDVSVLRKVFVFLDKWGLINFTADEEGGPGKEEGEGESEVKVKVEKGAPIGIRVVGMPNASKAMAVPKEESVGVGSGSGGKGPGLASYKDVYRDVKREEGVELVCGTCKESFVSKYYESTIKERVVICSRCFQKGLNGSMESSGRGNQEVVWTETETLLLLESVLKHGDGWELVAQNVKTKTKLECISRLIELPFGELILGSSERAFAGGIVDRADANQVLKLADESQVATTMEDDHHEMVAEKANDKEIEVAEPPPKKRRIDASDPSRSLIEQVALISSMVSPQITATAAEAAVIVLSEGNPLVRDIFYSEDDSAVDEQRSGNLDSELEGSVQPEQSVMKASGSSETNKMLAARDSIPLALRMRAAVGTALGAAAAHARLLADQEEREIEKLMAFITEMQLKKVQHKVKLFKDLEQLMEKEHQLLDEAKESIVGDRMETLRRLFAARIPRLRDHGLSRSHGLV